MRPGMMPILALPGEMTPGQFGPMRRDVEDFSLAHTFTMSSVGIPSVMHTMSGMPASSASRIASAANGGGTKIIVALAPVSRTASVTVLNTGQPSCVVPPLPGVTPPTTFVPYSALPLAWKLPSLPVMPCTISRVFLSTRTAILCSHPCGGFHHHLRSVLHRCAHLEVQSRVFKNLAALLDVCALEPQHDGHLHLQIARRVHHPGGQPVNAQNPAENVDKNRLHVLVGQQNLERVFNLFLCCSSTNVQKIRRTAAGVLDDVHGRHGQARAIHHAGDGSIQLDVIQRVLAGFHFQR